MVHQNTILDNFLLFQQFSSFLLWVFSANFIFYDSAWEQTNNSIYPVFVYNPKSKEKKKKYKNGVINVVSVTTVDIPDIFVCV